MLAGLCTGLPAGNDFHFGINSLLHASSFVEQVSKSRSPEDYALSMEIDSMDTSTTLALKVHLRRCMYQTYQSS